MMNVEYKTIRNLALVAAFLLAPVLSYASAYMLYLQIDGAKTDLSQELLQLPVQQNEQLPEELKAQIAAAIDLAEL